MPTGSDALRGVLRSLEEDKERVPKSLEFLRTRLTPLFDSLEEAFPDLPISVSVSVAIYPSCALYVVVEKLTDSAAIIEFIAHRGFRLVRTPRFDEEAYSDMFIWTFSPREFEAGEYLDVSKGPFGFDLRLSAKSCKRVETGETVTYPKYKIVCD